jgi:fatty-acyl-CoA synthase
VVLGDFFTRHAAERPDSLAIVFKDKRITYREYDRASDRTATGLLNLGVRKKDRIGIYLPNWTEFLFTYMGAAKIGAVAVPVSWRFTAQEIKFLLEDSGVSVLVMASGFSGMDFTENLESVRNELPLLKNVIIVEGDQARDWMIPYSDFIAEPGPSLEEARSAVSPEDPVLFVYTSGTTGVPKGAVLTQKNLVAYTNSEIKATGFQKDDSLLLDLPLNHVGGAVMAVVTCLNAGAKLVMVDTFDPVETLRLIQDEKITIMGQVPAQYALQLLNPDVEKYDLSSIRTAIVSSQPCPSELILEIQKRMGIFPQNAYGLTESTGCFTFTLSTDSEEKLKYTVGLPIEGVETAIMDPDNNILPRGEVGEVAINSEYVMKGYWNRPEEDAKVFDKNGFLHTGDMGKIDEDGYLVLVGRKKEMYIRGGENVYPPEIEEEISKYPDVFMAAVLGRPDPVMGEVGRAYVVLKPGSTARPDDLKEFLKDKLAKYKIPEDIIIRDQLPMTPLGKVKKLDLYREMEKEFKNK